jgi:hypothetical protein
MHASGAGAPGNVRATVTINLTPTSDGTALTYSADAVVGGPVAGVGQRMMTGVAKRMAGQFFKAIDDELSGAVVPIAAAPSAGARGAEVTEAAAPEAPRVFAGRAAAAPPGNVDLRSLGIGAAAGAAFTALGVVIGYLLGRRR